MFTPLTSDHYRVLQNGTPSQFESQCNNHGSTLEKTNQQADCGQTPRAEPAFYLPRNQPRFKHGGFWGERMRINDDHTFSIPPPYRPGTTGRGEIVLREGLLPGVANIEKIIPHRV